MKVLLLLPALFLCISAQAQPSVGIEIQAYPAGFIPGLYLTIPVHNTLNFTSRVAYNFTDRRDWGEHLNEEGGGFGLSAGIERRNLFLNNVSLILRSDLWFMEIDWQDPLYNCVDVCPDAALLTSGSSSVLVAQPTIALAYQMFIVGNSFIKPTVSFGWEINLRTEGENVGQGAILLAGFQIGRVF